MNIYIVIIAWSVMGRAFLVEFLTTCSLKDFSKNVHACHLKKWEKKNLIGHFKQMIQGLN